MEDFRGATLARRRRRRRRRRRPACYYGERKRSAGARRWVSLIDIMNYSIGVEKVNEPRSYETYGVNEDSTLIHTDKRVFLAI